MSGVAARKSNPRAGPEPALGKSSTGTGADIFDVEIYLGRFFFIVRRDLNSFFPTFHSTKNHGSAGNKGVYSVCIARRKMCSKSRAECGCGCAVLVSCAHLHTYLSPSPPHFNSLLLLILLQVAWASHSTPWPLTLRRFRLHSTFRQHAKARYESHSMVSII